MRSLPRAQCAPLFCVVQTLLEARAGQGKGCSHRTTYAANANCTRDRLLWFCRANFSPGCQCLSPREEHSDQNGRVTAHSQPHICCGYLDLLSLLPDRPSRTPGSPPAPTLPRAAELGKIYYRQAINLGLPPQALSGPLYLMGSAS